MIDYPNPKHNPNPNPTNANGVGLAVDSVLDSLELKFILKEEQCLALHLLPTGFLSLYIRHLV